MTEDFKNASPETQNAWRYVWALLAGNKNITPLVYGGDIAASEYLTYDAHKIYFANKLMIIYPSNTAIVGGAVLQLWDKTPAVMYSAVNSYPVYDSTTPAMKYVHNPIILYNVWFSKISVTSYTQMFFNGYKITN